jgi:hypothetical protein
MISSDPWHLISPEKSGVFSESDENTWCAEKQGGIPGPLRTLSGRNDRGHPNDLLVHQSPDFSGNHTPRV